MTECLRMLARLDARVTVYLTGRAEPYRGKIDDVSEGVLTLSCEGKDHYIAIDKIDLLTEI